MKLIKGTKSDRRKRRVRAKIFGTKEKPRLAVFKSNRYMYAQLIDDGKRHTLVSAGKSDLEKITGSKIDSAKQLGFALAKKALKKHITKAVFDRRSYRFHGKVKALAVGAREGGLEL